MNSLPKKLLNKQENQRQQTINLVLRAIVELTSEGYSIKIKDLMDRTGLSRSVFAKPHIRKILVSHGIVDTGKSSGDTISLSKSESSRISVLRDKLSKKDARILDLMRDNEILQNERALLRGRLFLLMQRMDMVGRDG